MIKVVQSKIAWAGASWRLRVNTLLAPDGTELSKGHIEHPGSVVLIPVVETAVSPQILMLRQYRLSLDETILELPAGTKGWQEDWLACAQRELREETGFRAGRLEQLGEIWPAPGVSDELMHIYLADGLQADPLPGDVDEEIECQPMPLTELVSLVKSGQIRDAKSIIGILWAADYLQTPPSALS